MILFYSFLTYISIIATSIVDGTPQLAGILVAVVSIVHAGMTSQISRITRLLGSRLYLLLRLTVCLSVGLVVLSFAPAFALAVTGSIVIGIGFGTALPLYRSITTGFAPVSLRGGIVSIDESLERVSATLTPIVKGSLIATGEDFLGLVKAVRRTSRV